MYIYMYTYIYIYMYICLPDSNTPCERCVCNRDPYKHSHLCLYRDAHMFRFLTYVLDLNIYASVYRYILTET